MTKITALNLIQEVNDRDSRHLEVRIEPDGRLLLEGCDTGPEVAKIWGDSDYEYWLTVPADYKDTLLLWLIQERFQTSSALMEWLKSRDIPYEFSSYT
jgi:hypothetical protein